MGPGEVDFLTGTEPDTWDISMTEPGIYYFTAEVVDENGMTYSNQVAVLAYDRSILDSLLQAKWDGMKAAMVAGDIDAAVKLFTPAQQQTFRKIFTLKMDSLAQIANGMQDIEMIYQKNNTAEYRIKKEMLFKGVLETITFNIYFDQGVDGIWRIRDFQIIASHN